MKLTEAQLDLLRADAQAYGTDVDPHGLIYQHMTTVSRDLYEAKLAIIEDWISLNAQVQQLEVEVVRLNQDIRELLRL